MRAEQAREEERTRLAGDMHDIVTHRVSLMVLQAGAMRVRAPDDATRSAAEDLRATGCQALAELRDLVAVLRTAERQGTGAPVEPAVLDLSDLVGESRAAGVDVRLDTRGPAGPASPVVVRTAYRVAQEALTNVHKHAPGARVDVRVAYEHDQLRLTVVNSAATRPCEIELGRGGTGLLGLQRRIELTGGSFDARPSDDGGFELVARLPVAGPQTPPRTGGLAPRTAGRTSEGWSSGPTPERSPGPTPGRSSAPTSNRPPGPTPGPASGRTPDRALGRPSKNSTGDRTSTLSVLDESPAETG
nr:histidine kinase [Streptomyces sp. SID3343]